MKNLLVSLLLLSGASAGAQDVLSYIPVQVDFLFTWNAAQIGKKVNTRQLMQQESFDLIFQEMVRGLDSIQQDEYWQILADPQAFGINSRQSIHFFGQTDEAGTYYGLLAPLINVSVFEGFIARQADVKDLPVAIEDYGAYKMARLDGYYVGWNAQVVIIAGGRPTPPELDYWDFPYEDNYEYYYDEDYDIEFDILEEEMPEEEYAEEQALEEWPEEYGDELVPAWLNGLFNRSFGPSLGAHKGFAAAAAKAADAHLWLDYQRLGALTQQAPLPVNPFLDGLYDDVHLSVRFQFNPGEMEAEMQMVGEGEMIQLMQKAYKPRLKKRMLRYIDKRFLLGYYAVRFDVKTLSEGIRDIVYDAMAETPLYGESIVRAMDVLGIVIDEDALYNLLKGDLMVAVTGIRRVETPFLTYEYDENFNASEVEIFVGKETPEFVLMASYGDEGNIRKIIRLAESFDMALNMGRYYQVKDYFLALHKGVLILTNDLALIENHLEKGLDKDIRLDKAHRRNLQKNVQALYWDAAATWKAMQQAGMGADSESPMPAAVEKTMGVVESLSVLTSRKVKPSVNSVVRINLADKRANALQQGMDLLNLLILEAAGLARI